MEVGNVRGLDFQHGIGLIEPEEGPDVLFFLSAMKESASLKIGHAVMFESFSDGTRRLAGRVKPI